MTEVPRLRMFAGPNGSGKSTIKSVIRPELLGVYINPDDIEKEIAEWDFLDLKAYQVDTTESEILGFFNSSVLLDKAGLLDEVASLSFSDDKLSFFVVSVNSYFASVAADFIRHKLLERGISFTFETVMSSADKIRFLQKAQQRGFRTYLYFVATEDPIINISRVRNRVRLGGHPVPDDKVITRYARSLGLLLEAICHSNRAYIFDNSGHSKIWLAEVSDGKSLTMKTDRMPEWFKRAVWDRMGATELEKS
ncbi:MAG: zeta toxin family protein [Chromatiaceae bacterium]|nr:zeta toxin family protein [Chromatiaceae bacterium]MBP8282544.1 zeta toxin family protein [Chromatiaceae bacterium]MBP8288989.1 zeta toxin family protein [Chromatiaceae bacterium]MBP9603098.1 zeta toxin family protein [Chromatiaceae bacterium]